MKLVPGVAYTDQGARGAGMTNDIIIRGIGNSGADDLFPGKSMADTVATYVGNNRTPQKDGFLS